MQKIAILQGNVGERIDVFLKNKLKISRTKAQQLIKEGRVRMGGLRLKPHTMVEEGEEVTVDDQEKKDRPPEHSASVERGRKVENAPPIPILYEDADILVIDKPAGVLVHPAPGVESDFTLLDWLLRHAPEIRGVGDPRRPGIVQRLDRPVSGVMIVAKTAEAHRHLKRQFQNRRVKKEYLALTHGHLSKDTGTIRLRVARSRNRARMAARPLSQAGQEAVTHYEILERFKNFDLTRITIETGRTHQIRAHFHGLGHPIAGDPLYRIKGLKPFPFDLLFLQATGLEVLLPSGGERRVFRAPIREELSRILKGLPRS
jgi:23S rRNA pseudouridine1911/1915/1917 synthase